jgi:CRISPR-associated protein Csm1
MRAEEFATNAEGIDRVGYLRMDVDRLGQIFANGLKEKYTLTRLSALSRQMSYFFKYYLSSLAEDRRQLPNASQKLSECDRSNLLFIYAGGDDVFVSGSWNEIIEFSFDVYQAFRAFTGHHPDITLSAGIAICGAKYPLYQAAKDSGEAENSAKNNGKDSLGLFGQTFKWNEWLGRDVYKNLDNETKQYLRNEPKPPELLGVLPFVQYLKRELDAKYSRSFVRNLLLTAQFQDQLLKNKKLLPIEKKDIRYFLHLPKIAYTLARLPDRIRNDPNFVPIRTSLKSSYNAPYFRAIATWLELLNRSSSFED